MNRLVGGVGPWPKLTGGPAFCGCPGRAGRQGSTPIMGGGVQHSRCGGSAGPPARLGVRPCGAEAPQAWWQVSWKLPSLSGA